MLPGSGGGNDSTRIIVFHEAEPKTTTRSLTEPWRIARSEARRRTERTPWRPLAYGLPGLVVDDVGERLPPAGLVRAVEGGGVRRIPERDEVFAMVVVGIAEQPPGQ